ncbi:substrate-binding domain-containing protein [Candidatus Protofrankia californiensis]|uniref:vWA domain-containing protein n=1 Tax=Candidatus Protofrankia californiensis TaxID=1839754 RepID=UPI001F49DC9B|nr:substrate-binding domain-containing protein [Candidatus Protofrankia californiensis]
MTGYRLRAVAFGLLAACACAFTVTACGSDPDPRPGPSPGKPGVLRILAGSEIADVEPLLDDLRAATGVTVKLTYTGTLDGAEKIIGRSSGADATWFSSDRYLRLLPGGATAAGTRTPIMTSPVVLGVRTSLATKFGWTGSTNVTWADVAAKVASGELTYAMTNPAASNSGFSALVGVAAALAGTSDALRTSDVRHDALTSFFSGQTLTAGSSGWLADAFVARPQDAGGMINYESVLLSLQRSGRLREPLTIVYPKDGIITADYPMLLLDPARQDEYTRVVNWLRSPAVQRRLQTDTNRRPAVPGVALDPRFAATTLLELPFPATQAVADELLTSYFDRFRRPSHAIFVLDVSGSMAGQRLADLTSALAGLAGTDTSLSGRFARFRGREKITLLLFNSSVRGPREFTVTDTQASSPDLAAIRSYVDGLRAEGGTAIYSALTDAYRLASDAIAREPGYLTSIVLMTDGENNTGLSAAQFRAGYQGLPQAARAVRTFCIIFGEARPDDLRSIATDTGGATFDARTSPLMDAFKDIRGYQ